MNTDTLFSSASDEWETPQPFFDALNAEFHFDFDVAATAKNTKCDTFFAKSNDTFGMHWSSYGKTAWCNPPYSRGLAKLFIAKASLERVHGVTTVMLLPARTDTIAFHTYIYDASKWQAYKGIEIRLLKGRLTFVGGDASAPFPSMVVVFRGAV